MVHGHSQRAKILSIVASTSLLFSTTDGFSTFTISHHHRMASSKTIPPPWIKSAKGLFSQIHRPYLIRQRPVIVSPKTTTRLGNATVSTASVAAPSSAIYLAILALQFGLQPILTKSFTPSTIVRSTVVLAQDMMRFLLCLVALVASGNWHAATHEWTLRLALLGAGIPSALYVIQNYCTLIAYQNLPPVTFNILNQTKTLSAAFCCFLIMGRRQSSLQILSLLLLLLSALVIEKVIPITIVPLGHRAGDSKKTTLVDEEREALEESTKPLKPVVDPFYMGVVPVLIASFISGLAGALTQRTLQTFGHNTLLLSMELSFFSIIIMMMSLVLRSPDGRLLRKASTKISQGWTWKTWIPVVTNALGGVVVGLVTKYSGAVRKGFALIFGLILSGLVQNFMLSEQKGHGRVSSEQVVGGILASVSVWMHSKFPPT